jgi:hypothetical protein
MTILIELVAANRRFVHVEDSTDRRKAGQAVPSLPLSDITMLFCKRRLTQFKLDLADTATVFGLRKYFISA